MTAPSPAKPKALAFDVFGTVVDWRTSIARESATFLTGIDRADIEPAAFADAWRVRYIAAMRAFKDAGRPFVALDVLHREMLDATLQGYGIDPATLDEALLQDWSRAWHRLDPWPDSVAGLSRLKARFPIVTLSNGNVALMLAMARRAGLPWDPRAYLATAEALAVAPDELCLVAAHHSDLAAARACGLMTAYVHRPMEYGGSPAPDVHAEQSWDWSATDLVDLAAMLGC